MIYVKKRQDCAFSTFWFNISKNELVEGLSDWQWDRFRNTFSRLEVLVTYKDKIPDLYSGPFPGHPIVIKLSQRLMKKAGIFWTILAPWSGSRPYWPHCTQYSPHTKKAWPYTQSMQILQNLANTNIQRNRSLWYSYLLCKINILKALPHKTTCICHSSIWKADTAVLSQCVYFRCYS